MLVIGSAGSRVPSATFRGNPIRLPYKCHSQVLWEQKWKDASPWNTRTATFQRRSSRYCTPQSPWCLFIIDKILLLNTVKRKSSMVNLLKPSGNFTYRQV
jgi:hypothetical protein